MRATLQENFRRAKSQCIKHEAKLWVAAGAKNLSFVMMGE
jgi:hypothetical protein